MKKICAFRPIIALLLSIAIAVTSAAATPTQKALDSALFSAIDNNDLKLTKSLLTRGASVNARNSEGDTALVRVSFVGDPKHELLRVHPIAFLQLFLKNGADVNLAGADGETALMMAAQSSPRAVRWLLEKGARVNSKSKLGETALMRAVMWECEGPCSSPDCVRLLLRYGANPNLDDNTGETALMRAAQLSFYGPAAASTALTQARMLLARGADVHARTRNGNTAFKWAKASGNPAFIRLIQDALNKK